MRAVRRQQAVHTIGQLWELWMVERKKDGFDNAIYNANWRALREHFANRSPDLITRDDCRAYAQARFGQGRAPATVHTELSRLRGCLAWASKEGLIEKPPAIWVPQPGRPRERVLTPEEAARLMMAAREGDPHVLVFVVLLFATGGRHRAILDLTWDRVDFDAGTIQLDELLPPDPMHKSWRKGRATVAMSDLARAVLMVAESGRQSDHVVEHGGRRLKTAREGFKAAVRRAGLEDVTPHAIRHTVATWLAGKVESTFTASLLGHRDEATTRKVYTHTGAEHTRAAVKIIDSTLAALPGLDEIGGDLEAHAQRRTDRLSRRDKPRIKSN